MLVELVLAAVLLTLVAHAIGRKIITKLLFYGHPLVFLIVKKLEVKPWRKVLTIVLLGLKIMIVLALILSLSSPKITVKEKVVKEIQKEVPVSVNEIINPIVVVVLDSSSSMGERGKIEVAKTAIEQFVRNLPKQFNIGFVSFSDTIRTVCPITSDRQKIIEKVKEVTAEGGTAYTPPLQYVLSILKPYAQMNVSTFVIFATDGIPADKDYYKQLLPEFRKYNITIFTIFIGSDPAGWLETEFIANSTGGKQYTAQEVNELPRLLNQISRELKYTTTIEVSIKVEEEVEREIPLYEHFVIIALIALISTWVLNLINYRNVF